MYEIKLVSHNSLTNSTLSDIIDIKNAAWVYSYEDQLAWINGNIKNEDIHVLLLENQKPVAYLNLIEIKFELDFLLCLGYGIGNVCALERGRGWGKIIMKLVNEYLDFNKKVGLLFCKESLVKFYRENNWNVVENKKLNLNQPVIDIECMIYGSNLDFDNLRFQGKLF